MRSVFLGAALLLTGCVSTAVRPYVGQDISEVFISAGPPERVFDLPDGRRAFQYRWGGETFVSPGRANITAQSYGNWTQATVTSVPATVIDNPGCLVTFLAVSAGNGWRVVEARYPKRLVC